MKMNLSSLGAFRCCITAYCYTLQLFCDRLSTGVTEVGRHSQNKFCLVSATNPCLISRRHANIDFHVEVINGLSYPLFTLSDYSLNGTYINDRRVRATCCFWCDIIKRCLRALSLEVIMSSSQSIYHLQKVTCSLQKKSNFT